MGGAPRFENVLLTGVDLSANGPSSHVTQILVAAPATVTLSHVTIVGNTLTLTDGASGAMIWANPDTEVTIESSILRDTPATFGDTVTFRGSNVVMGEDVDNGVIDADPVFGSDWAPGGVGTVDALDSGPALDLWGNLRPSGLGFEMGAVEVDDPDGDGGLGGFDLCPELPEPDQGDEDQDGLATPATSVPSSQIRDKLTATATGLVTPATTTSMGTECRTRQTCAWWVPSCDSPTGSTA